MSCFKVSLTSVDEVKQFVNAATNCPCEVDVRSGRYLVNGKSILGLFSLDLSQPAEVEIQGTPEQEEAFRQTVASLVC